VKKDMKARFFMTRGDFGSKKKVLIIYSNQWIATTNAKANDTK
jgi:hypothetical protein